MPRLTPKVLKKVVIPAPTYFERLDDREKLFVIGKLQGMTNVDAAMHAGYSKPWSYHNSHLLMRREAVRQALGLTLSQLGLEFKAILQPVLDGLKATKTAYIGRGDNAREITTSDHNVRLKASALALRFMEWETANLTPTSFTPEDFPENETDSKPPVEDPEVQKNTEAEAYRKAWVKKVEKMDDVQLIDAVFENPPDKDNSIQPTKSEKTTTN